MMYRLLVVLLTVFSINVFAQGGDAEKESLARQYYNLGDFEKANQLYEELYNDYQGNNYYKFYRTTLLELGNYEDAEKLSKKHFKRYNQGSTLVELGEIYQLQGNLADAEESFDRAIDVIRDFPNQVYQIATAFTKAGEIERALDAYLLARKLNSRNNYNFQVADIYSQLGRMEEMFGEYIALLDVNPNYLQSVKNMLSRSISDDPENENNLLLKRLVLTEVQGGGPEIYTDLLIWLYVQEKSYSSALRQVKALDKRSNGDQSRVFELASTCKNNGAYDIAVQAYDYIIEVGEDSPYYLDARIGKLRVYQDQVIGKNQYTTEDLALLEREYNSTLSEFGYNEFTVLLMRDLAHLQAFYMAKPDTAMGLLDRAIAIGTAGRKDIARCKLELADILLLEDYVWDAILLYGQVEKEFSEDVLGQEAKFRRARVSYFQGDFNWAKAQLDVLKSSTSKLIANDAMKLSLLISDNTALDTTEAAMLEYARADFLSYQNQYAQALEILEGMEFVYSGHSLIDEVLFKQGEIHNTLRNFERAAEKFSQVLENYSFDLLADDAAFQLGLLYENHLNDAEKASSYYEKIIVEYPSSVFIVEARKRYRALRGDKTDSNDEL
jgi:tetratricopeptide (TPR) repeat protein